MDNNWRLILNGSQRLVYFTSERQLRLFAKVNGYEIKRSSMDYNVFYTESFQYVPQVQLIKEQNNVRTDDE